MMYFEDGNTLNIEMVHLNEFDDRTRHNRGMMVVGWVISPVGGGSLETEMIVGPIVGHG